MIIAFVILIISFLAMIAMLGAKLYEIKAGRQVLAVNARVWAEKRIREYAHIVRGVVQVSVTKHFWTSLASFIGKKFIENVWRHPKVCASVKKVTDVVRGKKEIKSTGPVSFYLKDVGEFKKKVRSQ